MAALAVISERFTCLGARYNSIPKLIPIPILILKNITNTKGGLNRFLGNTQINMVFSHLNTNINTRVDKLEKSSSAWAKKEKKAERKKISKADVGGELLILHCS